MNCVNITGVYYIIIIIINCFSVLQNSYELKICVVL